MRGDSTTPAKFVTESGLADFGELDKALYLAFYQLKKNNIVEFSAADAARWISDQGLGSPNASRLATNLKKSRDTVPGKTAGLRQLHLKFRTKLEAEFPQLSEKSQDVEDDGTILPAVMYSGTRGYIESLAKQINRSYEENIFDGCAVLMRRLEEVLLILAYEELGIAAAIKDANGNYSMLEGIVRDATGNSKLRLNRNSREHVETFRKLGNYSAHSITYICRRQAIKEKIDDFRYMIEELLHKAGLKK